MDRRALPIPGDTKAGLPKAFAPPRTYEEEMLTQACAQVLGIERVSIYENFFELGGNSVLAIHFFHRLREALEVEIPLALLFDSPNLAALSEKIEVGKREGYFTTIEESAEELKDDAVLDPSIYPETPAEFIPNPASILITGVTGFLGAFLLYELLRQTSSDIYCLVRASSAEQGKERLRKNLEAHSLWDESFDHRIIAVAGDLSQQLLGLTGEVFEALASKIDVIYHNGGVVNYVYPYHRLKPANVIGTQEVLRLACRSKAKPVHFTSTIGIVPMNAPSKTGAGYEPESIEYGKHLQGGYLRSKWVAEQLVACARARGLLVTIHRPGTITGDSRTGSTNTDDFVCRMIKGCIQLGVAPEMNGSLDLTPVDYVSKAIVHLSKQKESAGKAFHLVNSNSMHFAEFVNWVRARGYALQVAPYAEWRAELSNLSERVIDNALFPLLPLFPQPVQAEQPAAGQMPIERKRSEIRNPWSTFQNTLDGLEGSSITCPPADARLLDAYFSYLVGSGFLQPPEKITSASR